MPLEAHANSAKRFLPLDCTLPLAEGAVWIVSVAVPLNDPGPIVRELGVKEHVGGSIWLEGETLQFRFTVPAKPPAAVTVVIAVADCPGDEMFTEEVPTKY